MDGVSSPARPQYVQYFNSPECSLSLLPHPSYHNMVVIPLMPNIPLKRLVQALSCFIGTFRVRGLHNKFCDDFFLFDAHADLYLICLFWALSEINYAKTPTLCYAPRALKSYYAPLIISHLLDLGQIASSNTAA